jgi:hypothetical protein
MPLTCDAIKEVSHLLVDIIIESLDFTISLRAIPRGKEASDTHKLKQAVYNDI